MHLWQVPFENTFVQLTSTKKISILQNSTNYDSFLIFEEQRVSVMLTLNVLLLQLFLSCLSLFPEKLKSRYCEEGWTRRATPNLEKIKYHKSHFYLRHNIASWSFTFFSISTSNCWFQQIPHDHWSMDKMPLIFLWISKRRKYQQKSTFDRLLKHCKKYSHLDSISIALKLKIRRDINTSTTAFLFFNVVLLFSWNNAPFSFVQIKWCEFKLVLTLTLEIRISNSGLQSFQRWEMIIGGRF